MTAVFVYGTLRTGGANWRAHLAPDVGRPAVTEAAFTMRSLGRFPVVEAGGVTAIAGEVFDVSDETLASLDRLEGHPGWYERIEIEVRCAGEVSRAWIYLMPPGTHGESPVLPSGDWQRRE
ncbi:MAG: gamma-glutamylcyclotransferase family protein [Phycisphaerales bacterium]|jgi:gamma-glutamylcyclotransferase (GGCT)/AIG2-like uncharacterized protein YtfP|nr:gamma-glutamylcyclotransferase family protein [Phycisphaerales bacterium]